MKIAVIGYSGAGKSTLAKTLGMRYGIPVLHLDTVQFMANWQERDREEGRAMAAAFMEQPNWVIDGNYDCFLQKRRLEEADRIVFLNFSRGVCLFRAVRRYAQNRNRSRESMADGCIEKFDLEFLRWLLWEGRTAERRGHYHNICDAYPNKTVVLKNRRQVKCFAEKPAAGGI